MFDLLSLTTPQLAQIWNHLSEKKVKRFSTKPAAVDRISKHFKTTEVRKALEKLGFIEGKKAPKKQPEQPQTVEKQSADEVIAHDKLTREQWLNKLAKLMIPHFNKLGYKLPRIAISCGFTSRGSRGNRIGECWYAKDGGIAEIFIKPDQIDDCEVAGILCHEMIHASLGSEAGHKKPFADAAKNLGLEGKPKSAGTGPEFEKWAKPLMDKIGPYPHEELKCAPDIKHQKHPKLINLRCIEDDYFMKVIASTFEDQNIRPKCPCCGSDMYSAKERKAMGYK